MKKSRSGSQTIRIDDDAAMLFRDAACIAHAFGVEAAEIRPEFLVMAMLESYTPICVAITEAIAAELPEFRVGFRAVVYEYYDISPSQVVYDSTLPEVISYSAEAKQVLQLAFHKWQEHKSTFPIPLDFVLAALFGYDRTFDTLDISLFEFDLSRQTDLLAVVLACSNYFSFEADASERPITHVKLHLNGKTYTFTIPEDAPPMTAQTATGKLSSLDTIETHLRASIIGQPAAIDAVMGAFRRFAVGLKHPNKPIGVFLFAGYTGVGKTELPKQLASVTGMEPLRLDMSEFGEKHNASRLFGAPPGYVGYDEGGKLTNFVLEHPRSVIIFDEAEKAHIDVFNTLLQIAEEGTLTDGQGREVDFRQSVIVLTTNIGSREAVARHIGFGATTGNTSAFSEAIERHFKPEFLGRIGRDHIVVFDALGSDDLLTIAKLELKKLSKQLSESSGIKLRFNPTVATEVVRSANAKLYGARDIVLTIERNITKLLTDFLLTATPITKAISVSFHPAKGYRFRIVKR